LQVSVQADAVQTGNDFLPQFSKVQGAFRHDT
jgi:hypothetical protein